MSTYLDRAALSEAERSLARARDALDILQRAQRPDHRWLELCSRVDPAKVISDLANEQLTGAGREASRELEKRMPVTAGNAARIPWQTLALRVAAQDAIRADIAGTETLGGFLVPTSNFASAAESLLPMLVLGRLGCTPIDAPRAANLNVPKVATSASVSWLSTEQTSLSESEQVFGQLALSPHTVGGYTEISRLLLLQSSPSAGTTVARDLMRKVGHAVDAVAFTGTGVGGQPRGLSGFTGVNAASGASYSLASGLNAVTATGDALLDSARPGFAANRAVASLLRQRSEISGSSVTLWTGSLTAGALHDFPAYSTSGVPSGTMFFGNWAYLMLCDFSGGLDVEVNPFANFQQGIVGLRALATIDVAPVWGSAFTAISSIT